MLSFTGKSITGLSVRNTATCVANAKAATAKAKAKSSVDGKSHAVPAKKHAPEPAPGSDPWRYRQFISVSLLFLKISSRFAEDYAHPSPIMGSRVSSEICISCRVPKFTPHLVQAEAPADTSHGDLESLADV